ncbi:MAG: tRNA 2-selenouridine(34) synthase MnmH [Casimicrobiaceae bacterium]|nr:tRNA 2-selenouridine(34) synthase MnmH [Casimicrobiaceae bacterium]MCX8098447.1 tRNA 2-selenouridine(34) synthase MnmH [Casimicrobiaceae bacterium]MDW8311159.1 tRNA 2-selenouridine(34) synthase MnmH [Burkholderiales bacterium]
MSAPRVSVDALEAFLDRTEIVDVRSPGEYAEDFIPGAVNYPILDDEERALVGTIDRQVSSFEARRRGAALAARNIAELIEKHFHDKPRDWAPLIYCWRGGKRSGFTTHMLREIGFPAVQLEGGYKAYRRRVNADLEAWPARFRFVTVCGLTGCGKTALLAALARTGAQVIDLEGLARHRGSLLGATAEPQPSQKRFDSLLWDALRRLDPARPVFVESESKKIGLVQMPEALRAAMQTGETVWLEAPLEARVAHIRAEYPHLAADPVGLVERLAPLKALVGGERLARWRALAEAGEVDRLFASLMTEHYDPLYRRTISNNYPHLDRGTALRLDRIEPEALTSAASALLERFVSKP